MKRLYYITDQIENAEHISDELSNNGIDRHHIHVLSKNETGVATHHLNGPNLFERVDFFRGALNGLLIALLVGILGLIIARFLWGWSTIGLPQFALLTLLMLFGSWVGGLIGFAHENIHLRRFHREVEEGRHLMMIDVQPSEERLVRRIIEHLAEATFTGEDKHILI